MKTLENYDEHEALHARITLNFRKIQLAFCFCCWTMTLLLSPVSYAIFGFPEPVQWMVVADLQWVVEYIRRRIDTLQTRKKIVDNFYYVVLAQHLIEAPIGDSYSNGSFN